MRIEDYHYYGRVSRIFGIVFIVIGVLLPILTAYVYILNIYSPEWRFPYLVHGIALMIIGIALIIVSSILFREYRIRTAES